MNRAALACWLMAANTLWAAERQDVLRREFERACEVQEFMGAASVTVNGRLAFSAACGWADVGRKIRNTKDTRFRIASITKQFTAAAVLLLREQGKFSLSDPIGKYVAGLPESWRSASIHQVLTHTSGVPTYTASPNPRLDKAGATPNGLLDLVRDQPLMYPHGRKLTYNNTGYILLGLLIEKASGTSYEKFVQAKIFEHVGMTDSGFDYTGKVVPRKASGYKREGSRLEPADFVDATVAWSACGFYSTVRDLTVWSEALALGTVLNADSTGQMMRVYPETSYKGMHYGYGVVLAERFGRRLQYHGGGITGHSSVLQHYPDSNLIIAVLSNLDSDTSNMPSWTLGDNLAQAWFEASPR